MEKSARKHGLCEKLPYVAVILGMIIPACIIAVGSGIGEVISYDAGNVFLCISAVLAMIIFKLWFSPDFKGFVKPAIGIREICIIMIPYLIYIIISVLEPLILERPFYFNPTVRAVIMSFAAGFGEETIFRICALAIVMRYVKKERRFAVMIVLALLFGTSHLINISQGADMTMSVLQMISTVFCAFFFTAIYLRSGSVILPIFAHGFYDYICFTMEPSLTDTGILAQQFSTRQMVLEIAIAVLLGIAGIYMLRKEKFTSINEIWNKKWSVPDTIHSA